ncbi:MAG: hypothetical protein Q8M22_07250 [Actinomycetota bacterium]|nr:hypothetical protein [Actinomycetota bacterium]
MTRVLAVGLLLVTVAACSSSDDASGSTGTTRGSADNAVTTTNPYACPEGEHLVIDGINPPRCEVHPPDWTGSNEAADPDQVAVDLARELVLDPQGFAEVIAGLSPAITDVAPVEFTLDDTDLGTAGISFTVTTSATTDAERDDVAWNVVFAIADFWGPGGGFRNETGQVRAGAVVTVDEVRYVASMELLMQVYDFVVLQPEFIAASRQA